MENGIVSNLQERIRRLCQVNYSLDFLKFLVEHYPSGSESLAYDGGIEASHLQRWLYDAEIIVSNKARHLTARLQQLDRKRFGTIQPGDLYLPGTDLDYYLQMSDLEISEAAKQLYLRLCSVKAAW